VPLLHGSQGCSTYIRRYLISHFKEPVDIACSNFSENTAIFGGGANLKTALDNLRVQYAPELIGIATTCLSETIGDDVAMFLKSYRTDCGQVPLPPMVHVSSPSYQGTHMAGFHRAVAAVVDQLAEDGGTVRTGVNLFPSMVSPADLRHLKEILGDFGLPFLLLPDYSQTLDGALWTEYQRIPPGGAEVDAIRGAGAAAATIEFGRLLARSGDTAGRRLETRFGVPRLPLGLPIGIRETDAFFDALEEISGTTTPARHAEERGRLVDALVDSHKQVSGARAALYGEADLVIALAAFLSEIGVRPVLCATGDPSPDFETVLVEAVGGAAAEGLRTMSDVDFVEIEAAVAEFAPDLIVGNSKGYNMARRLDIPLVRVGFPIHDRVGGSRLLHLGYRGAQGLFDRIANTLIERRQARNPVGYTYM
jgi:nitrogenase molybdenum-iron protein NifN